VFVWVLVAESAWFSEFCVSCLFIFHREKRGRMVKLIENQAGQYGKRPERGKILEWKRKKRKSNGVLGRSGGKSGADVEDVTVC